jgi:hypothetical protein
MCLGNGRRRINRTPPGREAASAGFVDLWNKEMPFKVRWKTMNLVLDAANYIPPA